jgi:hypothetical protein
VENQIETRKILDIITGIKVNVKQDELSETSPVENNKIVENVVQVEETITEEVSEEKSINYNDIFNIIKDKGVNNGSTYQLSFQSENNYITISLFNDQITVDVMNDYVIEEWTNTITTDSHFIYMRMENFMEVEKISININDMNEHETEKYNKMNEYLKKLYEY